MSLSTGSSTPLRFAVGDFNGDEKPDLAVPASEGDTVSIYLNTGGGNFSAPVVTTLSVPNNLSTVVSGDFNGDGKSDLAVGTASGNQVVIVLLSNGDGTFAVQPPISGSFGFLSGAVADFNGDGHLDLYLGGNGSTYLFLGKGDGTFSQGSIGVGSHPGSYLGVASGDFNGDKKIDGIAVDSGGVLDFFPGDGAGNLGNATQVQPSDFFSSPDFVASTDLNHDGKLDLLISGNGASAGILGNGDGTFQVQDNQVIPIFAQNANAMNTTDQVIVIAADLDQDGHPDAVTLDGTTGVLSLSLNDGTGAFPPTLNTPYTYQLTPISYDVATADFNGDGLPDIAVANESARTIQLLLSIKSLNQPNIALTSSATSALVGSALTFKAAITGGTAAATGNITLLDGSTQLAQQPLDSSGSTVFNVSDLAAGVHALNLSYAGDTNYAPGNSAPLNESITDFQIALTNASQIVAAGSTASYAVKLTPVAGFTGSVTLACSGLPSLATCNAPAISVGTGAATGNVTITTTATTTAEQWMSGNIGYACVLLGFFSLCGLKLRSQPAANSLLVALPFLLLTLLAGPISCGGSTKRTAPGTPTGTSTVTITASTTQNSITATHTAKATLVVQ